MTTISGPIHGGSHGWAFGATTVELEAARYVEEEYFFEGEAPRYQVMGGYGLDGRWQARPNGSSGFKTRAVVRRPIDPVRFNGTLLVEWINVSAGFDIYEAGDTPVLFDEGFAYVGISAQRAGVHGIGDQPKGLVDWDPERYGHLHIEDDALSFGVFGTVTRALLEPDGSEPDPLNGLSVEKLLGLGGSQSAGRLATYVNAVHPLESLFDGFVLFTWFGSGPELEDTTVFDPLSGSLPVSHPTRIRDDLSVPVMIVNAECETLSTAPSRREDNDRYRFWEVAGAPHAPRLHMERIFPKQLRDGLLESLPDTRALSPVAWAPVLDAAMVHTHRWVNGGPPPPIHPVIETGRDPLTIIRDANGNALGGVRVPEIAVPIARHVGAREESGDAGLMGKWFPFDPEELRRRYGSVDGYLGAYEAAARAAIKAGVWREADLEPGLERARTGASF